MMNEKIKKIIVGILVGIILIFMLGSITKILKNNDKSLEPTDNIIKDKSLGKIATNGEVDKNGLLKGRATVKIETDDDGLITISGVFNEDKLIKGEVKQELEDIEIIKTGDFHNGKLNGEGEIKAIINGQEHISSGIFKDDVLNGAGKRYIKENNKIIEEESGLFENGELKEVK